MQLTEKTKGLSHNQRVLGSSPSGTTFNNKPLQKCRGFFMLIKTIGNIFYNLYFKLKQCIFVLILQNMKNSIFANLLKKLGFNFFEEEVNQSQPKENLSSAIQKKVENFIKNQNLSQNEIFFQKEKESGARSAQEGEKKFF